MTKYKLEYIWLDGYSPTPNLRGKTQIKEFAAFPTLDQLPLWGFDGSSTLQAEGHSSDCVLKPVAIYPDGARTNGALVMCEVMLPARHLLVLGEGHSVLGWHQHRRRQRGEGEVGGAEALAAEVGPPVAQPL